MFVSEPRWTPRRQGDLGEASAIEWLAGVASAVFVPVFSSPDYDLVAEIDDRLVRVQVKTSGSWDNNRWAVAVCMRGGNQSWNRIVKRMSPARCDALFVLVADGRRWFIPSHAVEAGTSISLGGPKYSEYEVEAGRPFAARPKTEIARQR